MTHVQFHLNRTGHNHYRRKKLTTRTVAPTLLPLFLMKCVLRPLLFATISCLINILRRRMNERHINRSRWKSLGVISLATHNFPFMVLETTKQPKRRQTLWALSLIKQTQTQNRLARFLLVFTRAIRHGTDDIYRAVFPRRMANRFIW